MEEEEEEESVEEEGKRGVGMSLEACILVAEFE